MAQPKHMRGPSGFGTTSPKLRELRKCQDTLTICGPAIIIYGAWNIIKGLIFTSYGRNSTDPTSSSDRLTAYLSNMGDDVLFKLAIALVVLLFTFLVSDSLLRLYVGRTAYREGKGTRRGRALVAPAIVLAVINILFMTAGAVMTLAFSSIPLVGTLLYLATSGLIDLASLLALFDVIRAASQAKRLRAELEGR